MTVTFTTVFGKRYVIERTPRLLSPDWTMVSQIVNGNGTPLTVTDTWGTSSGITTFFYRVRIFP